METLRFTDEYQRRGIPVIRLENEHLLVEILAGKGGDITEIRDKRTDINLLFESPHEWRAPGEPTAQAPDATFSFMDHYPGGWQDVLPAAGQPATVAGAPFGQHGESTIIPWEATGGVTDAGVQAHLSVSLTRYPLEITRTIRLDADDAVLTVNEAVTNDGEVAIEYSWLQHIAFGPPLVGPNAELSVPCDTVLVDPDHDDPNARFEPGAEFDWPYCTTDDGSRVDLREIPPKSIRAHDLVALADLTDGYYTLRNPSLDLAATVRFPPDLYEYVWYWQPFGGFEAAPYFGRAYAAGLEPATSIPNAGLERAIDNDTANSLAPGATQELSMSVTVTPIDS